jgi:hypothetical protein
VARSIHASVIGAEPAQRGAPKLTTASGVATQRVSGVTHSRVTVVGKVVCTVGNRGQYPPGAGPTYDLSPQVSKGGASDGALASRATQQGSPVGSTVQQPQIQTRRRVVRSYSDRCHERLTALRTSTSLPKMQPRRKRARSIGKLCAPTSKY